MTTIKVLNGDAEAKYLSAAGSGTELDPYVPINDSTLTSHSIGIQDPLPTDGDSVYEKDVWAAESVTTDWVDTDTSGEDVAVIPFTNLHTRITNSTSTDPKILTIHFNRTVAAHQIGLGCTGGGDFSNVSIDLIGSGGVVRTAVDDSSNNTKLTSKNYPFEPQLFNAVTFSFNTTDEVCLSNITIQKSVNVSAQIQGLRSDDTVGTVNLTNGNNLKVSLEEFESDISTDGNSKLNTAPYLVDEHGTQAQMLSDDIFLGSPVVINSEHHEIHCGDSYELTYTEDLGNGDVAELAITVPDEPGAGQAQKLYHLLSAVDSEAEATVEIYEGSTFTGGTSITPVNRNRNSSLVDFLTVVHSPSVTTDGTKIYGKRIGSGRSTGGSAGRSKEFVLRNNETYLLRITNEVTTDNYVNAEIDYYVHPGV